MRQNTSWPDPEVLERVKDAARVWAKERGVPEHASLSAFVREACAEKMERDG